ncbi:MAG: anti-sigma factor [Lachnospiraceae bacterium]|nr:anti-sigma factor [Lachnospiraceae bacterium]
MSRDLKHEYEAMLDQEIPDLWSRIEPRLADKKGTQNAESKGKSIRTRRIKRSTIAVWGSLAAACVCLAIILPAWRGNEKSAERTNQTASAESADTTAADMAPAAQEMQQSDNGMMNGMASEAHDDLAGEYDGFADDADTAEGLEWPKEEAETASENNSSSEPVSAYECCGEILDAWQTREGFFYQMELIWAPEAFESDETVILLWQKEGFLSGLPGKKDELTVGGRYTVFVEPEIVDGETRYVLISYETDDGE